MFFEEFPHGKEKKNILGRFLLMTNEATAQPFYKNIPRKRQAKTDFQKTHSNEAPSFEKKTAFFERPPVAVKRVMKLFDREKIPADAKAILDDFDAIIQGVRPLNAKQRTLLSKDIANLSRALTSERSELRMGYMNETTALTAYAHYFTWWNLVRLTRLFASLPADSFALADGDFCLDIGSGPLTVPIALYLSRPELRAKSLTWYCLDYSQNSLALGEDLFLSVAARLGGECAWKIIRVKGGIGTSIKHKAALITSANMFNETLGEGEANLELLAKKQALALMSYADTGSEDARKNPSILVIEPGVPLAARFISLLRAALIRRSYGVLSPCPHFQECPMNGQRHGKNGRAGKWCNFAFSTLDAPKKLLKLSENAKLPKDRAVLSYVFVRLNAKEPPLTSPLFRIASDKIRLDGHKTGHYACTADGLSLLVDGKPMRIELCSGDLVELSEKKTKDSVKSLPRDEKSGAFIQTVVRK